MIALALALGLATTASPPSASNVGVIVDMPTVIREWACGIFHTTPVSHRGALPQAHKLGDLPSANIEYAVLRLDANGCQEPVVVHYDYRGDGHFASEAAK